MISYPAIFDVSPPERSERLQLLLRVLIMVVLGLIGISIGWVFLLLYFALPLTGAVIVESKGAEHYLGRTAPAIARLVRWLLSFEAYMGFLLDRFPTDEDSLVRFEVTPSGTPSPRGALLRLLTSFPEALILLVLGLVAGIVWCLSAVCVLFVERVPWSFLSFQRGLLRWQARLFAYHASLVDVPPPYSVDVGPEKPARV